MDQLILEAIVTTSNEDGTTHLAPMGPIVDRQITTICLRPFRTSHTFSNLRRTGQGIVQVVDDVELFARGAINVWERPPPTVPCPAIEGSYLADACRWFAFRVRSIDESQERTTLDCDIVASQTLRDFFGFNRAKHAVIEAAILATRIGIVADETIISEFARLEVPVQKTAGIQERAAFGLLREYVLQRLSGRSASGVR